jgi:N-acetylmuramic acid 6-phosphate etherase
MPYQSKWQDLPTEAINPETLGIDRMPVPEIIDLMVGEDRTALVAVQKERDRIALGVEILVDSIKKGGRIYLVGAGTSGRLGVLEAAEIPVTFGTKPGLIRAVMAGGRDAVFRSREGVEDNFEEGARSVARMRVTKRDVVLGVSASGITQFVRGALTNARNKGARTIFVTCWPGTELQTFVDLIIAPAVGPEVIAGSTRLKAGTATKLVLNMLTTISMVRMGKTYGNLMVDVQTGSDKLRDRARRIVAMVSGIDLEDADRVLQQAKWNVKAAIVMHKTGLSRAAALKRLKEADGFVREAIGEELGPTLQELLKASAGERR